MTQLEMERAWDEGDAGAYEGGSENEEEPEEFAGEEGRFAEQGDLPAEREVEDVDFDLVCEGLVGAAPAEAEAEIRGALRRAEKEISEANVVGLLLKVFRIIRDFALEDREWDTALLYCAHLTDMCDRNFSLAITGEGDFAENGQPRGNFPATVVAAVYAEAGRTFSLAGVLPKAQSFLEKALYVYGMVPSEDDVLRRIIASIKASLARVMWRRPGQSQPAQDQFLETLDLYSQLPVAEDTLEFVLEYCEFIGDDGGEALSSVTWEMLDELISEKFGEGSDQHLRVLKKIGDVCTEAERPELGGPALAKRARVLKERAEDTCSMARTSAAAAAELEAAVALEAALPKCLEQGNLRAAAEAWEEALQFRESLEGPDSPLCVEMRMTLAMLQQAVLASAAQASQESFGSTTAGNSEGDVEEDAAELSTKPAELSTKPEVEEDAGEVVPDTWDA